MAAGDLTRIERSVLWAGLAGLVLLSWLYLFQMARGMANEAAMHAMMGMAGSMESPWAADSLLMTFLMWAVMMVAMMVPSAAPMILTFATVNRRRADAGGLFVPTWIFVAGYLTVWTAFSLLAALLQSSLQATSLLAASTMRVGPALGGSLFVLAGLYQWTPWKKSCLSRCAAPLDFLLTSWREGRWGAFVMGLHHGAYCVGCCALLMLLLLTLGVMNLLWVATLGGIVLFEKLLGSYRVSTWVFGGLSVLAGIALIASAA